MFCSQFEEGRDSLDSRGGCLLAIYHPLVYFIVWFVLCINPILKIKVLYLLIIEGSIFVFSLSNIVYIILISTFEFYNLVPNFSPPYKLYLLP